jgi:O-antigen/teichoic acid export membrane protein
MTVGRTGPSGDVMLRQTGTNLVLQGLTLASKTILLFVLARYLTVADVGVFGILSVTISLGVHLVGADFYAFNTREILARPEHAPRLIRDQALFHGLTYVLLAPAALILFAVDALSVPLLAATVGLLVVEHVAQEIQRLLFTLSRPIPAAICLFLRGGPWIYAIVAIFLLQPELRTVETVVVAWLAGSTAAIAYGSYCLRDLDWADARAAPVDRAWIRRGLRVALPFLVSTLAFRALLTVDRYALQLYWGSEAVGVFTFYAIFRNAIQGFLESSVLFILRPHVITAHAQGDVARYRGTLVRMSWMTMGLFAVLALGAVVAIGPLLSFVGTPEYGEHRALLWPILIATGILALSEIPHSALYAQGRDRALIASAWLGLLAAVILNVVLVPGGGPMGAAYATAGAALVVALVKGFLSVRSA